MAMPKNALKKSWTTFAEPADGTTLMQDNELAGTQSGSSL